MSATARHLHRPSLNSRRARQRSTNPVDVVWHTGVSRPRRALATIERRPVARRSVALAVRKLSQRVLSFAAHTHSFLHQFNMNHSGVLGSMIHFFGISSPTADAAQSTATPLAAAPLKRRITRSRFGQSPPRRPCYAKHDLVVGRRRAAFLCRQTSPRRSEPGPAGRPPTADRG